MKPSLFNTALPIIQAPMAGVQNEQLALAVSEAGGLGSLPCAMLSPAQLIEQLEVLSQKQRNLVFAGRTFGCNGLW